MQHWTKTREHDREAIDRFSGRAWRMARKCVHVIHHGLYDIYGIALHRSFIEADKNKVFHRQ